jgi:hypothetical protein
MALPLRNVALSNLARAAQGTIEEEAAAEDQGLLGRFIDYIQVGPRHADQAALLAA